MKDLNDWFAFIEGDSESAGTGRGTPQPNIDINGPFMVGDIAIPRYADDDAWIEAGRLLLENHDVDGMQVDGRPITNIEMHAIITFRRNDIAELVEGFFVRLFEEMGVEYEFQRGSRYYRPTDSPEVASSESGAGCREDVRVER